MEKTINKKVYDTDSAVELGYRYDGWFGASEGYEERLFITDEGQYFIYGVGGPDSKYAEPVIALIPDEKAEEWKAEHAI